MSNRIAKIKKQTKKQMERELYNIELDEYAEQIRNDLRKYRIKYSVLYNFIKDDLEKAKIALSETSMKNMLCRKNVGYNVISRIKLIAIIRKSKLFKQAKVALEEHRLKEKEVRENRKFELIELLNNEDTEFGREYSQMEKYIHHTLDINPSQQIRYQEKEDGIFRDKKR
jgi:hypothetical protein